MNKQEEIKVGICALFSNCFTRGKLSGKNGNDWANKYTDTLMRYLHENDVVIRVDTKVRGKLVNALWDAVTEIKDMDECHAEVKKILGGAGLAATESLVEG